MNYIRIDKDDLLNGEGIRVVLWVAGCNHNCKGCHNPETHNPNAGQLFDDKAKKELFEILSQDYISGVTFSGGDPLYPGNLKDITALAKEINILFPNKTIWLYTGFTYDKIKAYEILNYIDVLIEGPYIEKLRSPDLPWIGSSNQTIIRIK